MAGSVETAELGSGHGLPLPDLELAGQDDSGELPESVIRSIVEGLRTGAKWNAQASVPRAVTSGMVFAALTRASLSARNACLRTGVGLASPCVS